MFHRFAIAAVIAVVATFSVSFAHADQRVGRPIVTMPWVDVPQPAAAPQAGPVATQPSAPQAPAERPYSDEDPVVIPPIEGVDLKTLLMRAAAAPTPTPTQGESATQEPGTPIWETLFKNARVQKFISHLDIATLLTLSNSLRSNDNLRRLPWVLLGWAVFMMIFRAWRKAKTKGFWRQAWVGFYCTMIFGLGAVYVIPALMLGTMWGKALWMIYRALYLSGA